MDYTLFKSMPKRRRGLHEDKARFFGMELAAGFDVLAKIDSLDIFQHNVMKPAFRIAAKFVQSDDIRMVEPCRIASFAIKAFQGRRVLRQFGREHLERDDALEVHVFRFVDLAHAARSDVR
jgi:hypothetical protein